MNLTDLWSSNNFLRPNKSEYSWKSVLIELKNLINIKLYFSLLDSTLSSNIQFQDSSRLPRPNSTDDSMNVPTPIPSNDGGNADEANSNFNVWNQFASFDQILEKKKTSTISTLLKAYLLETSGWMNAQSHLKKNRVNMPWIASHSNSQHFF